MEDSRRERPIWYDFDHTPMSSCPPDSFWSDPRRFVDSTIVDDVRISTVFLMLDQTLGREEPPILYETAIFWPVGPEARSQVVWRYPTRESALAGHDQIVAGVREWVAEGRKVELLDFLDPA